MKKYFLFVGARPNFMKASPLCYALDKQNIDYEIYHSGQHYDTNLSGIFHKQLNLSHVKNMSCESSNNSIKNMQSIFKRTKEILIKNKDSIKAVVVFGDVITTLSVALAAHQLKIKLAHVESGLRSFDIGMPEELIRITTDHFSDILFSPSEDAVNNLRNEGMDDNIFMVGNIMIDCLENFMDDINNREIDLDVSSEYIVATFHRPENIENLDRAYEIFNELAMLSKDMNVFFPMHPRTKEHFIKLGIFERLKSHGVQIIEPLGYFDFMKLILKSKAVVTDSGGIQEETTYLNIPCFTVRKSTERPITIKYGTNQLISPKEIGNRVRNFHQRQGNFAKPPLWDGKTSERIIEILERD